jgi:hypothetical protein
MPYLLTDNQMSDLFFNHEKPNLDAAYASEGTEDDIAEALELDAKNFSDMSGAPVEWLINDYNARV